jgi:N utilization substance protein B
MNRKQTRELAMHLLYQMEIHQDFTETFFEKNASKEPEDNNLVYYTSVISSFLKQQVTIDQYLEDAADNWKVDRVNKVELAILRLALTEMFYIEDIPRKVSINEAVDLGKKFSDDEAGKFINGILSRYAEV